MMMLLCSCAANIEMIATLYHLPTNTLANTGFIKSSLLRKWNYKSTKTPQCQILSFEIYH